MRRSCQVYRKQDIEKLVLNFARLGAVTLDQQKACKTAGRRFLRRGNGTNCQRGMLSRTGVTDAVAQACDDATERSRLASGCLLHSPPKNRTTYVLQNRTTHVLATDLVAIHGRDSLLLPFIADMMHLMYSFAFNSAFLAESRKVTGAFARATRGRTTRVGTGACTRLPTGHA